jgi:membrane protease YdiL (CAAX protease family)
MISALGYLLALTGAESLTIFVNPVWGVLTHVAILAGLIVHSSVARNQIQQRFLLSLALAPLVRIVSLSMPLAAVPRDAWYPLVYAPLLGAGIVTMRILGYKAMDVGFVFRLSPIQFGVAESGIIIGTLEYLILRPEPLTSSLTLQAIWLPALMFLVTIGLVEEFIFRGVMQHSAFQAFGWRGIVLVSGVFAVLHLGFFSWLDVAFVFGVAVFFAWAVKKTGSLVGVILAHGVANIVLYLIAPLVLG